MNILDNKRKSQILEAFDKTQEIEKAYTEGIYADTPSNRKLGRVGMSYSAYANKVNGGYIEQGDIRDFKRSKNNKGQTEYIATIDEKQINVHQEGNKKDKYWVIEKEGEKIKDEKGNILKFTSANNAVNKIYTILEEDKGEYKFPSPDYLSFKGILWKNPDESDEKIHTIHIHKYGKRKPEITITAKNGISQTNIILKNSEMKKLLVGLSKKENVSLKLDYDKEDMKFWSSNKKFETILEYDADKGMISYKVNPNSSIYAKQEFSFPASALDRVLEQFKNKK